MKITCIADLHGHFPKLSGGDLLIISGDMTKDDTVFAWKLFFDWVKKQEYRKVIAVAGNHDNFLTHCLTTAEAKDLGLDPKDLEDPTWEYLCDNGCEFEGLKIWGSPWTLRFDGINPRCMAFTGDEELIRTKFDLIPEDTDILVTHGPPYGIMDGVEHYGTPTHCGSMGLLLKSRSLKNLKLFCFGHIHEGYGTIAPKDLNAYALLNPERLPSCASLPYITNCSHVNEYYKPVNAPVDIEL